MLDSFDIVFGESVFCTELNTGQKHSGNFKYAEDGITTSLVSFDGFFYVRPDAPIFLMTEKLKVVSLYDSFGGAPGTRSRNIEPIKQAHIQKIFSNTAIVGDDKWEIEDRVKRVSFQIKNSMEILRNTEKIKDLSMDRLKGEDQEDDRFLLNLKADGLQVRLYYTASYEMWGNEPKDVSPRFEIEFDDAVRLGEHLHAMQRVVWFCSMAIGVPLVPSEIRISRQSLVEFIACIESNKPASEHRAIYRWPEFHIGTNEVSIHGSPFVAFDEEGLTNLSDCLSSWLERGEEWDGAYALMMGALERRNEVSAERLLNACKWLEQLPNALPNQVIDKGVVSNIAAAAIKCAGQNGLSELSARINGCLRTVGLESRAQHFIRLLSLAWGDYHMPRPVSDMVSDLMGSQKLRGKAAHGNLDLRGDGDFQNAARYIESLEALCFLLILQDLPLNEGGKGRLMSHRLIETYHLAR